MYIVERKQYTQLTKDKFMGDIYMKYRSKRMPYKPISWTSCSKVSALMAIARVRTL